MFLGMLKAIKYYMKHHDIHQLCSHVIAKKGHDNAITHFEMTSFFD